ncbi:MAG: hypothetical protein JW760_01895 [Spirochaetales bacterium]|nr:hypothetical protein [Spirochaetales bacterium]
MTDLTKKVLACRESGEGYEDLVREISLITYHYPKRKYGWNEDQCGDFFCSLIRRIPGLIERFEYSGIQFESYLYSTLTWQMKTFSDQRKKQSAYDRVLAAPSFSLLQESPGYSAPESPEIPPPELIQHLKIDSRGIIRDRTVSLRVICMILRNSEFMDDAMVSQASRLCGCTPEWLEACIIHLRERMADRRSAVEELQRKRSRCFLRVCMLQDTLRRETDADTISLFLRQLKEEQQVLSSLTQQISRYPLYPSHREIAQVLGIPKGTVDSGLHYLKNVLDRLSQSSFMKYA